MAGHKRRGAGSVSEALDELATMLIGEALDALAEGAEFGVVASAVDAEGNRLTYESSDPAGEGGLEWAHGWVRELAAHPEEGLGAPVAYAICYLAEVEGADALICEFGERGAESGWSSYSLVEGIGAADGLRFSEPAPAGATELLL